MKKGFTLLELIFVLVIISIIGALAVPKYMQTKDAAVITTIKRDVVTITTSIQTYYLINGKIDNIEDAVSVNSSYWTIEDNTLIFKEQNQDCITISYTSSSKTLKVKINEGVGNICKKLIGSGVKNNTITLY